MVGTHAIKNGKLVKIDDATLNVTKKEVQFGYSIYESLRVVDARAVFFEDHMKRLRSSAKGLQIDLIFSQEQINSWVKLLIKADDIDKASLRILVVGGKNSEIIITASTILAYDDSLYESGIVTFTYEGERLWPQYKTSNLLMSYMALKDAKDRGGFESILEDRNGYLLEGTRSNFYAFHKNDLYTAGDDLALFGITRMRALNIAKQLNINVIMEAPTLKRLKEGFYEEAFISSTSMATMPIKSIDGIKLCGNFDRTMNIHKKIRELEKKD
jgi:branched-subunit amino acid aminotransferase/4-amino-4-deoxychorismate lyase